MLSARKKLILLKTETTYGTDASPGATNAMLASNVSITPLEAETVRSKQTKQIVKTEPKWQERNETS